MKQRLGDILHQMGDRESVRAIRPVSGGSISQAYRVQTENKVYFIKYNEEAPEDLFEKEARGLELLRETETVAVPEVQFYNETSIVLEWIEGAPSLDTEDRLGQKLALLHRTGKGSRYGLHFDNYIGRLPQPNDWACDWVEFLRDQRLGHQAQLAEAKGYMPKRRKERMARLLASLDEWAVPSGPPALLHGDLWGGNWIVGAAGEPYLIDPAVFYGERELELAFTELFGGFSRRFYDAYEDVWPLSDDYRDRRPLYQLYYLLVHLTLFGESYGPSVDRVLAYYVG